MLLPRTGGGAPAPPPRRSSEGKVSQRAVDFRRSRWRYCGRRRGCRCWLASQLDVLPLALRLRMRDELANVVGKLRQVVEQGDDGIGRVDADLRIRVLTALPVLVDGEQDEHGAVLRVAGKIRFVADHAQRVGPSARDY